MSFNFSDTELNNDRIFDDVFTIVEYNKLLQYMSECTEQMYIHNNLHPIKEKQMYNDIGNIFLKYMPTLVPGTNIIELDVSDITFVDYSANNAIFELLYIASRYRDGIDLSKFEFRYKLNTDNNGILPPYQVSHIMEYKGRSVKSYHEKHFGTDRFCQLMGNIVDNKMENPCLRFKFKEYTDYLKQFVSLVNDDHGITTMITSFSVPFAYDGNVYDSYPHAAIWGDRKLANWIKKMRVSNTLDDVMDWIVTVNNISKHMTGITLDFKTAYTLCAALYSNDMIENNECLHAVKYFRKTPEPYISWQYFYGFIERFVLPKLLNITSRQYIQNIKQYYNNGSAYLYHTTPPSDSILHI